MNKLQFILLTRIFSIFLALCLFGYLAFANTLPFGATEYYSQTNQSVSTLSPLDRVEAVSLEGVAATMLKDDLIYFTTKFSFKFDTAKVKITFRNANPEQTLEVGYKDKSEWHYDTQVLDAPLFHYAELSPFGEAPVLYHRNQPFLLVEDFLTNPPETGTIGTLDYTIPTQREAGLTNYTPKNTPTIIDTPLRGKHVIYAYLENEPFHLKVKKQDLNWYEDPDVLTVTIYKDDTLVYTAVFDDDGIRNASKQVGPEVEAVIKHPGPELPEAGVYKIVFEAEGDVIIKRIETNLHKLVFTGPIYPVGNSEVYPSLIVGETATTTLYTNSNHLAIKTDHAASLQTFFFNSQSVTLNEVSVEKVLTDTTSSLLVIPKSDVIVSGRGYFAFSPEQFFLPTRFNVLPITKPSDLDLVDYVLTPYTPPVEGADGFSTVEREFDVTNAVPAKEVLSWIIRAPGLKESGNEVVIKNIEVTYSKEGWWQKE